MAAHYIVLELLDAGFKDQVIYGAITQEKAHDLVWPDVVRLISDLGLESTLGWQVLANKVSTPAGAEFHVIGLKDTDSADKLRGFNIRMAILDEVQAYDDELENIISNVIRPRLMGTTGRGSMLLLGTPGYVLSGTWFELSTGLRNVWKTFHWTMLDNPHYPDPRGTIDEVMREKGMSEDDPYIQREYFGRWKADGSKLVHPQWTVSRLPEDWKIDDPRWVASELHCTVGIDYGYDPDPSAWIVLAQRKGEQVTYVVHTETAWRASNERWTDVTRDLNDHYAPVRIVADYGGGGAAAIGLFNDKHSDELGVYVEHAQKSSSAMFKRAQYDSMNAYLRTGRLVLAEGRCDELIEELTEFVWKDDARRKTAGADHCSDAFRYAFQAHTDSGPADKRVNPASDPYEQQRLMNERVARQQAMQSDPFTEDFWEDDEHDEEL